MDSKPLILIVDDDPDLALNLKDILDDEGYNTMVTNDGQTALTLCHKQVFDLGLIDIKLPDIQGVELVERLVEVSPTTEHILITGYASIESAIEAVGQKNIIAYEQKPLDMNHLLPLIRQVTERKRAEEALKTSKEYASDVIDSSLDMIITVDMGRNIVEFNKAAEKTIGYSREEVIGRNADILYSNRQEGFSVHKRTIKQGQCAQEILNRRKNGEVFTSFLSSSTLRNIHGEMVGVMGVSRDITEQKRAQEQIKTSLKEKDVLLKEIHHRVKNNLQIISSLLDMRIMRTDNQQMIDLFEDTRSKIHTMSLIHTQLYQSDRFDRINIGDYIKELVGYLSQIYTRESRLVTPVIESSEIYLSMTQAMPCALALNEVISNAFKHAFQDGQKGTIRISLNRAPDDRIFVRVKDDGIGIPEEIDIFKTNGLGLKLFRNLIQEQLKGEIRVARDQGTEIFFEFNVLKEEYGNV